MSPLCKPNSARHSYPASSGSTRPCDVGSIWRDTEQVGRTFLKAMVGFRVPNHVDLARLRHLCASQRVGLHSNFPMSFEMPRSIATRRRLNTPLQRGTVKAKVGFQHVVHDSHRLIGLKVALTRKQQSTLICSRANVFLPCAPTIARPLQVHI